MLQVRPLDLRVVGLALSALFGVTYLVCALAHLLFPAGPSFTTFIGFFPGFGPSIGGFLLGLVEGVLYAWWATVIFVPIYNYLQRRGVATPRRIRTRGRPPQAA